MDIAGYRIVRTLGRGGMATVYLAVQQSVEREVALKVMSTALLGDEQFGERFLREARIAARLRHPGVVQVHDVGISGDHHYIAMEFLSGGPVMGRAGEAKPVGFSLRVARQIAAALDYAGAHGVVHRDIKPDNILLREDGSAVLTDFGIAHAADASRMTRTGAIIGTPHYMSPEQARGQPVDGRADLYSL
ncbi:MAG: serine/threonine protein kinase, partial [Pararhodobacter sp.]|nr:serine/threonine protein kinase [Pararhodobacter sp.]